MRQLLSGSRQMIAVAIGWQVYILARETRSIEESALLLGLVGLVQFAPVLALSLVGGQAADRLDRKTILIAANMMKLLVVLGLIASSFAPSHLALGSIFVAAGLLGCVNAFTPSAANALYPTLVPQSELPLAIAWNSLGFQTAAILGPAIGGYLYIGGAHIVYGVSAAMTAAAILTLAGAKTPPHSPDPTKRGGAMVLEGLRYVRSNKIVLGAISLDLVVVLFGGATALLPVFAYDILNLNADGLGALRAAPAIGAVIVAYWLARKPLARHVGPWLLAAVAVFGAAMLGFALSRMFWLSMGFLAVTGAADMISVYVRQSLIQLATPQVMRGRVSSVSYIFIAASNELGEFESGVAARILGPVGAVIFGGVMAIGTALLWTRLFPQLSTADRFEDAAISDEEISEKKPVSA